MEGPVPMMFLMCLASYKKDSSASPSQDLSIQVSQSIASLRIEGLGMYLYYVPIQHNYFVQLTVDRVIVLLIRPIRTSLLSGALVLSERQHSSITQEQQVLLCITSYVSLAS
jgi:hypothetical protein